MNSLKSYKLFGFCVVLLSTVADTKNLKIGNNFLKIKDGSIIQIDKLTGDFKVSTTSVVSECAGDDPAPKVTLRSVPLIPPKGVITDVIWEVENVNRCIAGGSWRGDKSVESGPQTERVPVERQPEFFMTCFNDSGHSVKRFSPIVNAAVPLECAVNQNLDLLPLIPIQLPIDLGGGEVDIYWQDVFRAPFGDLAQTNTSLALGVNQYATISFTAPSEIDEGRIDFPFGRPSEGGSASNTTVSMSRCPGDFSEHLSQPACRLTFNEPGLRWSTAEGDKTKCRLIPGETYFLNVIHSSDRVNNYNESSCEPMLGFNTCGVQIIP